MSTVNRNNTVDVRTSKKTHRICITKTRRLTIFRKGTAVYSENQNNPKKALRGEKSTCWALM